MASNFNKKMCLPKLPDSYRRHLNFRDLLKTFSLVIARRKETPMALQFADGSFKALNCYKFW